VRKTHYKSIINRSTIFLSDSKIKLGEVIVLQIYFFNCNKK